MIRLKVNNFGPIRNGFSENAGFMEMTPVTVLCGEQATGKSTIAKLYATFTWLEKALIRMNFDKTDISKKSFFIEILKNHRIDEYLMDNTEIKYEGNAYIFTYQENKFIVEDNKQRINVYKMPKIMYIPSERNLLTVIEDVEKTRNLPVMLSVLFDEYQKARKSLAQTEYQLPVSDIKIQYDAEKYITNVISQNNYRISITSASSGIQSVAPLSIVSRYLSDEVTDDIFKNIKKLSSYEREQIKNSIKKAYDENNGFTQNLIQQFDSFFLTGIKSKNENGEKTGINAVLKSLLRYFFNTCFINIVEEPEQNLYPDSQKSVLYELMRFRNSNEDNQLVITTHSPYIISYLTLAAKAAELLKRFVPEDDIEKIVPVGSTIDGDKIIIYEVRRDGSIKCLKPYENLPSDENLLNKAMEEQNEQFAKLLELEETFCK